MKIKNESRFALEFGLYFPRLKKKTAIIFGPTEKQKYKETMAENNWNSRGIYFSIGAAFIFASLLFRRPLFLAAPFIFPAFGRHYFCPTEKGKENGQK